MTNLLQIWGIYATKIFVCDLVSLCNQAWKMNWDLVCCMIWLDQVLCITFNKSRLIWRRIIVIFRLSWWWIVIKYLRSLSIRWAHRSMCTSLQLHLNVEVMNCKTLQKLDEEQASIIVAIYCIAGENSWKGYPWEDFHTRWGVWSVRLHE